MTEDATADASMPFLQHLEELRKMVLHVIAAVAVGAVVAWWASDRTLDWLIENTTGSAVFLKPQGAFMARLKVTLVLGILLTLPYSFWKLWSFVGPGLLTKEKRVVLPSVLSSIVLFYLGIAFSYFLLTPVMVKVLIGFGSERLQSQTEVHYLLDVVFTMGLACGLVFQTPLVAAFLAGVGILTPRRMRLYWRHSIVVIFVVAAILTPADPISQLLLAAPLLLLYGLSFLVVGVVYRGRQRARRVREADRANQGE